MKNIKCKGLNIQLRKNALSLLAMGISLSLAGCGSSKKNDSKFSNSSSGMFYAKKDLIYSDDLRDKMEYQCGSGKLVISYLDMDTNDYISGAELMVYDSVGNEMAHYITDDDSYVVNGLVAGRDYVIQEMIVPEDYDNSLYSYRVRYDDSLPSNLDVDDYYIVNSFNISRGNDWHDLAEEMGNRGSFIVGAYEFRNDYLPGVKFNVTNENGDLVEEWVSTHKTHTVSHLEDGKYEVNIVDVPEGYVLGDIDGYVSVEIKDGEYKDENSAGPIFYFEKIKKYNRVRSK